MKKIACELFAGVGGFHLGLSRAGWKITWANQWEPSRARQDAYECYKKHFPETEVLNVDIAEVNNNPLIYKIPNHTLLVGGFPCQDYSVAATASKGIEGKKGVLWWEIEKILERKRPPFVLLENVDRLLKSPAKQRGRDFGIMLKCFDKLGYGVEWRVINAAEYGFAQRRRRIFIFAYNKTTKYYKEVEKDIEQSSYREVLEKKSFFNSNFKIKEVTKENLGELQDDILTVSDEFKFEFLDTGIMSKGRIVTLKVNPDIIEPVKLRDILEDEVEEKFYLDEDLEKWKYMKGAKAEPRKSSTGHEYMYREGALAFPDNIDLPARTILTSESSKNRSTHVVKCPSTGRLRVLTPIEVERLNGFDDDWTNTGMTEKFRYFCMGNALVVGLITKMGDALNKIIDAEK